MSVRIRLHGKLKRYAPADRDPLDYQLDIPDPAPLHTIVEVLGIPVDEVYFAVMEGAILDFHTSIPTDATVELFSVMGGG